MHQVLTALAKLFFEPRGFKAAPPAGGMLLPSTGDRLFAAFEVVLQDGGAHHTTWHYRVCRDGRKMCTSLFSPDGIALLTRGATRFEHLVVETSDSCRNEARYLEYYRSAKDTDKLQRRSGISFD